jgi:FHS family L-fucose permease-like MFS transporter
VALFCYVGAQVAVWSYLIRYVQVNIPQLSHRAASDYLTGSLGMFLAGRAAGDSSSCLRVC